MGEKTEFSLSYKPPYRFETLLAFYRDRALKGVELVGDADYARTVLLRAGGGFTGWFRVADDPQGERLVVRMSESLLPVASDVLARIRRQFDLDCDPSAVEAGIAQLDAIVPGAVVAGTRLPGAFDPFETTVRAVLGQQVSVQAANTMAARIIQKFGRSLDTGIEGLGYAFPTAQDFLAMEDIESALGELGVVRTRSRAIRDLSGLYLEDKLGYSQDDVAKNMAALLAVKGIGPWTANYIAMRTMGYADAFLETDAGVKHALPEYAPAERVALAEAWRPYRSYAVISLWNSLA